MSEDQGAIDLARTRERMTAIGDVIKAMLPKGWGFFLFVTPPEATYHNRKSDPRANYISNIQRGDALNCMKEFLVKNKYKADWMKDIE